MQSTFAIGGRDLLGLVRLRIGDECSLLEEAVLHSSFREFCI